MNTIVFLECSEKMGVANVKIQGNPIEALAITMTAAAALINELTENASDAKELARNLAEGLCENVERNAHTAEAKGESAESCEVHMEFSFDGGDDE